MILSYLYDDIILAIQTTLRLPPFLKNYTQICRLYAHGIASMVVTNHLQISNDEIKSMMTEVFQALNNQYNGGNESETTKEK